MKFYFSQIAIVLFYILSFNSCIWNNKSTAELLNEKGGLVVTLEMQEADYIRLLASNKNDSLFIATLNKAIVSKKSSQSDFITLFENAFDSIAPKGSMLAPLFMSSQLPDLNYQTSNKQVLDILRKELNNAFNKTIEILRSRIKHFGEVKKPNIQRIDSSYRIKVELPGISDPDRVRKLLTGSGMLEFWETYDNTEFFEFLRVANQEIKILNSVQQAKNIKTKKPLTEIKHKEENDSLASLIEKVNEFKTQEGFMDESLANYEKENPLFAILRPNIDANGLLMKGSVVGISKISDTAKVNEYLNREQVRELFPKNSKLLWEFKPLAQNAEYIQLVAIKISNYDGQPILNGDVITNAKVEYTNNPEINLTMNAEGAKRWENITGNNIGKSIAIVLDNHVYSAPIVNSKISGGSSNITGNFTIKEAQDFVNILMSGMLYMPVKIIKEEVITPASN